MKTIIKAASVVTIIMLLSGCIVDGRHGGHGYHSGHHYGRGHHRGW